MMLKFSFLLSFEIRIGFGIVIYQHVLDVKLKNVINFMAINLIISEIDILAAISSEM